MFEYAVSTRTQTYSIAHIVHEGHAYCSRRFGIRSQRWTEDQVRRTPLMSFCISCERKALRSGLQPHTPAGAKPDPIRKCDQFHGTYTGDQCPTCKIIQARLDAIPCDPFSSVPATKPADQTQDLTTTTTVPGSYLTKTLPVPGTSLRGEVRFTAGTGGNGDSWMWSRTIRGRLFSFTVVHMPSGDVRWFVKRFDCTSGPQFGHTWIVRKAITIRPDTKPTEVPELAPIKVPAPSTRAPGTQVWCRTYAAIGSIVVMSGMHCCSLCSNVADGHHVMADVADMCTYTEDCPAHPGVDRVHHFPTIEAPARCADLRHGMPGERLTAETVHVGHLVTFGAVATIRYRVDAVGQCPSGFVRCFQLDDVNAGVSMFLPIDQLTTAR